MSPLERLFAAPVAHRGRHTPERGVVENSLSAVRRAFEQGYGVEIDVQLSADGEAIVIHDDTLDRTTDGHGDVAIAAANEISRLKLKGAAADEAPPTLGRVLDLADTFGPSAALVIEVKDQSRRLEPTDGALEQRVGELTRGRKASIAVMSFNPHSVAQLASAAPEIPRGLIGCRFEEVPDAARREELANLCEFERLGAQFVSYDWRALPTPRLNLLHAQGTSIMCWTIRSAAEAQRALRHCDQITFENFDA